MIGLDGQPRSAMAGVRLTAGGRHRHPVAIMMAVNEIMVVLNTVLFFTDFLLQSGQQVAL